MSLNEKTGNLHGDQQPTAEKRLLVTEEDLLNVVLYLYKNKITKLKDIEMAELSC